MTNEEFQQFVVQQINQMASQLSEIMDIVTKLQEETNRLKRKEEKRRLFQRKLDYELLYKTGIMKEIIEEVEDPDLKDVLKKLYHETSKERALPNNS